MGKITDLREGRTPDQVKLFIDGSLSLHLLLETCEHAGLQVGQELSTGQLDALTRADQSTRCRRAAARYLSYRPRSESELRQRLYRRGFEPECVDATLARLKQERILDDRAFAGFWLDNRQAFRPRSQRLTALELRRKGVSPDVVREAVQGIDDAESAYQAARSRVRALQGLPHDVWLRKMGDFLRRRGFSYEVAAAAMTRLWREVAGD